MKEKVLVTGSTGLVGSHFVESNQHFSLLTPSSKEFNLLDEESIKKYLEDNNPDWIVNFAAQTDVNMAEQEAGEKNGKTWQINVEGVQKILNVFHSKNFIQISTDMVFPGNIDQPGPYAESDIPPNTNTDLTWYGWTKNRAENIVRERGATILRIIYPLRAKFDPKLDYLRGPLKKFSQGNLHPLFEDQQISVSFIPEISETITNIIQSDLSGIFHVSSDTTTPYSLISRAISELGGDISSIKKSSVIKFLETQTNKSRYPVYGGLKTKETENALEMNFSTWQTVIDFLIAEGLSLPTVN